MILQANFHYEIDKKEKVTSTSCKNGNDLYLSLNKLLQDIQYKIIYLDNTFQKVFAISEVELIRLPEQEEALENFIDLVFHISCQKGISVIGFHFRKQEMMNQAITIYKSEKILQLLDKFDELKTQGKEDKQESISGCFVLKEKDYQDMIKKLNVIFYGKEEIKDLEEQEQIFSLIIQQPNFNRSSSCFIQNKNEIIKVLSNFQISKAQLYESNLIWTEEKEKKAKLKETKEIEKKAKLQETNLEQTQEKENKIKPKLFLNATVIQSIQMKSQCTYETTIKVDNNKKSENHLIFVFNQKVLAFQFPLKIRDNN